MKNVEQSIVKCNIIQWENLPLDVKKAVVNYKGFADDADIMLGGSDFDAWDVSQTYKDTLSMAKLKEAYKDYLEGNGETSKDYSFDTWISDFNLELHVWLAKNSKKIDLNVHRIIIHVNFYGFKDILK